MANLRPLPEPLAIKARLELNENPETIDDFLTVFKVWIRQSPHLRARTDDQFLVAFLRGCKFSLEKAKEKLDLYYTARFLAPDFYPPGLGKDPRLIEILRLGVSLPLPKTITPDGPRIFILRIGHFDPQKFHVQEIFQMGLLMAAIILVEDDNFVVSGQIQIIDMAEVSLGQLAQFSPALIKNINLVTQEAIPARHSGFHFINPPPGFEGVLNTFKALFNSNAKKRADEQRLVLESHGSDLENLYKHIPKEILPEEYGGDAGSIDSIVEYWEKKLLEYQDYFMDDEKYGTDEKRRLNRVLSRHQQDIYGLDGTFRQLGFD